MRISGFDHIVLNVADVECSLRFYVECLGLAPERVDLWRRGDVRFPSVRVNEGTIIDLVADPAAARDRALNLAHFCLVTEAPDIAEIASELAARGVPTEEGPAVRSGARGDALSIYFRDPDANLVELRTYAGMAERGRA
jgi:catechol 2,3-dioxygenase-like lactoylglutathione lyase family enzyme